LVCPANNRSRIIQGRVLDLSCAGISVLIAADLPVGEVLELEFGLPYASVVVRLKAVVRSRQDYQYGLEFTHLSVADRVKIDQTCTALDLLR
jgi:PilZ domain